MRDSIYYQHLATGIIGKDKRKSYFLKTRGHTNPPPGQHQTSFADKPKAPSFGFGTSTREKNYLGLSSKTLYNQPGPGSYRIPVHIGKTATFVSINKDDKYKFV